MRRHLCLLTVGVVLAAIAPRATPQASAVQTEVVKAAITTPKEHFGFNMGDDYCLANYKQFESYFKKIEGQTDRLKVVNIGKTEEGRDQLMGDRHVAGQPQEARSLPRDRRHAWPAPKA